MLIYAFLLILILRPNWGLLGFFTLVASVLWALFGYGALNGDIPVLIVGVAIQAAIFFVIGAVIVGVRKWMQGRKSGDERRAEALVALARADAGTQDQR
jgi:hypothetical protein